MKFTYKCRLQLQEVLVFSLRHLLPQMARLSPVTHLLLITTRWHLDCSIICGQGPTLFTCSGACIAAADPRAPAPQLGRNLPEDELP